MKGEADAAYDSSRVLQYYAHTRSKDPSTQLYLLNDPNAPTNPAAFTFKKGHNDELVTKLNAGLQQIKANGELQKIQEKWFGTAK